MPRSRWSQPIRQRVQIAAADDCDLGRPSAHALRLHPLRNPKDVPGPCVHSTVADVDLEQQPSGHRKSARERPPASRPFPAIETFRDRQLGHSRASGANSGPEVRKASDRIAPRNRSGPKCVGQDSESATTMMRSSAHMVSGRGRLDHRHVLVGRGTTVAPFRSTER